MRTSVLVIEHDPQTMRRLLRIFRRAGHLPLLASTTSAAIPLLMSDRFDVVVTDDGSDAMSAEGLARAIQSHWPASAPPVVRMTSRLDVDPSLFAAVVPRPVDPFELLRAVERALAAAGSGLPRTPDPRAGLVFGAPIRGWPVRLKVGGGMPL